MDAIAHTIAMWQQEAIIVLMTFIGMALFHTVSKLWSAPADAMFGAILGAAIGASAAALYLTRHVWGFHVPPRAAAFTALYLWCVLVMFFFAARNTHRFKLFVGLVSQAGIVYALFIFL